MPQPRLIDCFERKLSLGDEREKIQRILRHRDGATTPKSWVKARAMKVQDAKRRFALAFEAGTGFLSFRLSRSW